MNEIQIAIIIAICLIVIVLIFSLTSLHSLRKTTKLNNNIKDIITTNDLQYKQVKLENDQLKAIKHDLKKQVEILKGMQDNSDIAIDKLIIEQKKKQADELNIVFTADASNVDWPISDVDITGLLGNLLDNAIEAAQKTNKPWIYLFIAQSDSCIKINVKNSKISSEQPISYNLSTTKADETNHGFGTRIIKTIVDDSHGTCNFIDHADTFEVNINLPI